MATLWPNAWYSDATSTGTTAYSYGTSTAGTINNLRPMPVMGASYPSTIVDWKYIAEAAKALGMALKGQKQWEKAMALKAKQPPPPPIRMPAPIEFNRYINASDLLEEFIKFLGENDVRKGQVMELPLELFIKWLVIRACEEDKEEPNVTLALPPPKTKPRCMGCQKFIGKGVLVPFHNEQCASHYYQRIKVA